MEYKTDLATMPDVVIPADAWREAVYVAHSITSDDLSRMTAEFEARGGSIHVFDCGLRTDLIPVFNGRIVAAHTGFERAAQEKIRARHRKNDEKHCIALDALLDQGVSRNAAASALGISDHSLQRLLRAFFSNDSRANQLRAGYRQPTRIVEQKTCSKCHTTKSIEEFHRTKRSLDGHVSACKECESLRHKAMNGGCHEQPSAA